MECYFGQNCSRIRICFETLNGRLPLKLRSDRPQNLGKRVSDDSQHSTFRRCKTLFRHFFDLEQSFFIDFTGFLRRYAQTDLGKRFLAFFCFRCTYYHLGTTKNHPKYVHVCVSMSLFIVSTLFTYVHACFVFFPFI